VRLVIAGSDHPLTSGYLESIRERWNGHPDIEFHGYVPEQEVFHPLFLSQRSGASVFFRGRNERSSTPGM